MRRGASTPLGLIKELPAKRNPGLPSRVPDLQVHSEAESDAFGSLSRPIRARTRKCFGASWDTTAGGLQLEARADDSILVVQGLAFDRVKAVGDKAPGWDSLPSTTHGAAGGPGRTDAFRRTVLVDLKQGSADGYRRLEPRDLRSTKRPWRTFEVE
ncbi:hypothetical protein LX36DRAFT_713526 [Colletotrichum falcatum]|nr:hypothetical protein LX36DRAFT_713526 [Colletotrichum falcatum]